jgi:hypothetical protein
MHPIVMCTKGDLKILILCLNICGTMNFSGKQFILYVQKLVCLFFYCREPLVTNIMWRNLFVQVVISVHFIPPV